MSREIQKFVVYKVHKDYDPDLCNMTTVARAGRADWGPVSAGDTAF
jgi:hypothetical protein